MTITEAIADCYLKATGKTPAPTADTSKYNRIVELLDYYQRRWAREPGIDWYSLYDPIFSLGTVTATDTFDLDTSTVRKISNRQGDFVRILWTDGEGYTDYTLVAPDTLKDYFFGQEKESGIGHYCAQQGTSLVFNHTFTSEDSEFGGEIQVPVFLYPEAISSDNPDSDEVQVDDPDWLVTRAAAEYVRNDLTRLNRYPDLLAEANEIMGRMKDDQEGQFSTVYRPWTPLSGIGNDSAWS